ncbi:hypothetical protein BDV27DRAFT_164198 [Aspergillus caelatus]|uniref:NmrA-like domain-containing protein n=1 Tax=Aspergillus caelatus TaxID=61420 RepID=A0A5N6ZKP3_9EURO|nr:uncharacterized protein BDV27DRAFT_164198 [Aspergillus caelatus]KAE8357783.1 hypothetical protein BDV27DRAFT_164198 [Aspergillus caelatus]
MKYLITGATGGLGGHILDYFITEIPLSDFAASSSNPENRSRFESRGVNFRHLDYEDPTTLSKALHDVENLLFISTNANVIDVEKVKRQHRNVVDAARQANVKHVWYTSLPFGGLTNDSEVAVQRAHLATEKMLQESGLTFTCIREGIYVEGFPLFLNWYPETTRITLPGDGEIAFTSRVELAECTARLMILGGFENRTVLLTAEETITAKELVSVINETTGRRVELSYVSQEEFVHAGPPSDRGGKSRTFFETLVSLWESAARGELRPMDGLMREILGRDPLTPRDAVRQLLVENRDHTWHQMYSH